jgi:hypothetical protein
MNGTKGTWLSERLEAVCKERDAALARANVLQQQLRRRCAGGRVPVIVRVTMPTIPNWEAWLVKLPEPRKIYGELLVYTCGPRASATLFTEEEAKTSIEWMRAFHGKQGFKLNYEVRDEHDLDT